MATMRAELAKAVALVKRGQSYKEAAATLGLTRDQVAGACLRADLKVGKVARMRTPKARANYSALAHRRWQDPDDRAKRLKAMRAAGAKRSGDRTNDSASSTVA